MFNQVILNAWQVPGVFISSLLGPGSINYNLATDTIVTVEAQNWDGNGPNNLSLVERTADTGEFITSLQLTGPGFRIAVPTSDGGWLIAGGGTYLSRGTYMQRWSNDGVLLWQTNGIGARDGMQRDYIVSDDGSYAFVPAGTDPNGDAIGGTGIAKVNLSTGEIITILETIPGGGPGYYFFKPNSQHIIVDTLYEYRIYDLNLQFIRSIPHPFISPTAEDSRAVRVLPLQGGDAFVVVGYNNASSTGASAFAAAYTIDGTKLWETQLHSNGIPVIVSDAQFLIDGTIGILGTIEGATWFATISTDGIQTSENFYSGIQGTGGFFLDSQGSARVFYNTGVNGADAGVYTIYEYSNGQYKLGPVVDNAPWGSVIISGIPRQGETLIATISSNANTGTLDFEYQWESSSNNITWEQVGTNSPELLITSAVEGKSLRLRIRNLSSQTTEDAVIDAGSAIAINNGPASFRLEGTASVGNILTLVTEGDPDGNSNSQTKSITWERSVDGADWQSIGGSGPTYNVTIDDIGNSIRARIQYTDGQRFVEKVLTQPVLINLQATNIDPVTEATLFSQILPAWKVLLSDWAASGALTNAALLAFGGVASNEVLQEKIKTIVDEFAANNYGYLPSIKTISAGPWRPLSGYSRQFGTKTYFNLDILESASQAEIIANLTYHLGVHILRDLGWQNYGPGFFGRANSKQNLFLKNLFWYGIEDFDTSYRWFAQEANTFAYIEADQNLQKALLNSPKAVAATITEFPYPDVLQPTTGYLKDLSPILSAGSLYVVTSGLPSYKISFEDASFTWATIPLDWMITDLHIDASENFLVAKGTFGAYENASLALYDNNGVLRWNLDQIAQGWDADRFDISSDASQIYTIVYADGIENLASIDYATGQVIDVIPLLPVEGYTNEILSTNSTSAVFVHSLARNYDGRLYSARLNKYDTSFNFQWSTEWTGLGTSALARIVDAETLSDESIVVYGYMVGRNGYDTVPLIPGYDLLWQTGFLSRVNIHGEQLWTTILPGFGLANGADDMELLSDTVAITSATLGDGTSAYFASIDLATGTILDEILLPIAPVGGFEVDRARQRLVYVSNTVDDQSPVVRSINISSSGLFEKSENKGKATYFINVAASDINSLVFTAALNTPDPDGLSIGDALQFEWQTGATPDSFGWSASRTTPSISLSELQISPRFVLRCAIRYIDALGNPELVYTEPLLIEQAADGYYVGGAGSDIVYGSTIGETISTFSGNDIIASGDGNDVVLAGGGNDIIVGGSGAGNDYYDGGSDLDTVKYTSATLDIVVDLAGGFAAGPEIGYDTLSNIENVIGGQRNDLIIGTAGSNVLDGYTGDDTIHGGGGNDTLIGGDGIDTAVFSNAFTNYTFGWDGNTILITDKSGTGSARLTSIENLKFSDRNGALNTYQELNRGKATFSIAGALALNAPTVGDILTGTAVTPDPDGNGVFSYAWQTSTDGTSWSTVGANNPSYTVAASDEGKRIQLVVSYADALGFAESVTTSAGIVPVLATPSVITGITVTGNQVVLQFSEAIDNPNLLTATRFTVRVANLVRPVIGIAQVSGNATQLSLTIFGTAARSSQAVTVAYTDLTTGNDRNGVVQDLIGNDMATTTTPINATTFSSAATVSTLAANYINLILTGTAAINGTGNTNANTITGNSANNNLSGLAGNDNLLGERGNDTLIGGTGADLLTGSAGTDTFRFALTDSLLGADGTPGYDRITDLVIGTDRIDGPNAVSPTNLRELGAVTALTQTSIAAVLTSSTFVRNGAATFTYLDGTTTRTFVALNNGTAGFSSTTDAIIDITGYSGSPTNLAIV